jgi:hypothetical protein
VTWTIAHPVPFFPSTSGGKIHAKWAATNQPVCWSRVTLHQDAWIWARVGMDSGYAHPMMCKTCLRLTTKTASNLNGVRL